MNKAVAIKVVGGVSSVSKMPGSSFGLPCAECKTGSKLAKIPGTVCSDCYAQKGRYRVFKATISKAQYRRFRALRDPQWVEAMVAVCKLEAHFRWFDSGDLPDALTLSKIVSVARQTPETKHWLATRERSIVRNYLKHHTFPDNLVVRVSATYPDVPVHPIPGANGANVHKEKPPTGEECQAHLYENTCGPCRKCWDKSVAVVSYKHH